MTAAVVVLAVVVAVLAGALAWLLRPRPVEAPAAVLLEERLRRRVIVTLKSGAAFGGVLFELDERAWVLREATAIGVGENRSNLIVDGEVVLLAAEIAYVQMP